MKNNTWTLEDLYRSIARGWFIVAALTLAFGALGYAAFAIWPLRYEATAMMTVEQIAVTSGTNSSSEVNMETERVIATSTAVLSIAVENLDSVSVQDLADNVNVAVPKGSQILAFSFTATTPDAAAERANAIATAYSEHRVANAESVVNAAIVDLEARIDDLEAQLATPGQSSETTQTLQAQLLSLKQSKAELTSATFSSGSLVSPATSPASSTRPSLSVFIAGGLFLGLFLGCFSALIYGRARLGHKAEHHDGESPSPVPPLHVSTAPSDHHEASHQHTEHTARSVKVMRQTHVPLTQSDDADAPAAAGTGNDVAVAEEAELTNS